MFLDDLASEVREERWNRVEIQLRQMYQPRIQFGLSFLEVYSKTKLKNSDHLNVGASTSTEQASPKTVQPQSGLREFQRKFAEMSKK